MGRKTIAILGLFTLLSSGACASYGGRYYGHAGPPSPRYERPYGSPGRGYAWQPGYYRWDGRRYEWVRGRYARIPRGYSRWQEGRWDRDRRGWFYIEGGWR